MGRAGVITRISYLGYMKHTLIAAAILLTACGKHHSQAHEMAFERAMQETRHALNYPDATEWPTIEDAHITEKHDTITVMFTVMASNGFGVKSSEMTLLDFRVDSCAHLLNGFIAGGLRPHPDLPGRPCDFVSALDWDQDHQQYWDSIETAEHERALNRVKHENDSMLQTHGL